jgi:hypothetical protein
MDARDIIRLPDPRENVEIDLREVVRDVDGRPQVFLRIKLAGYHFPHRSSEPFLLVGDVVSRFVVIDRDETTARAYFDRMLPRVNQISFGYGNRIGVDFDFAVGDAQLERLDRGRLPKDVLDTFENQRPESPG